MLEPQSIKPTDDPSQHAPFGGVFGIRLAHPRDGCVLLLMFTGLPIFPLDLNAVICSSHFYTPT